MMESQFIPYTATTHLPEGNVLILAPHPDDEVFGCAGAIMQHVAQGHDVKVIIVTDGQAAMPPTEVDNQAYYVEMRKQESRKAQAILGYQDLAFWDIPDRKLVCNEEMIQRVIDFIETHAIDYVYATSVLEVHPDHQALANIAMEAVKRCGEKVHLVMYEVGIPLHPTILLDITPFQERKQAAMQCFPSQLTNQNYARHITALNVYRSYTLSPEVKAAEAYYRLNGKQLQEDNTCQFGVTLQTETLKSINEDLQTAYKTISALETEVNTYQQTLTQVYRSRSWRLTKPLRWITQLRR